MESVEVKSWTLLFIVISKKPKTYMLMCYSWNWDWRLPKYIFTGLKALHVMIASLSVLLITVGDFVKFVTDES